MNGIGFLLDKVLDGSIHQQMNARLQPPELLLDGRSNLRLVETPAHMVEDQIPVAELLHPVGEIGQVKMLEPLAPGAARLTEEGAFQEQHRAVRGIF